MKDSRFDLDLPYGQLGEQFAKDVFTESITVEVKTERDWWFKTGNIAIEYACNGKPSGIKVTEAKYLCIVLKKDDEVRAMYTFPTKGLVERIRTLRPPLRKVKGGDGNRARMLLMPIDRVHELIDFS